MSAFKVKCMDEEEVFTSVWQHVDSLQYLPRDAPPWQEEPATDAITPYWF